MSPKRACHRPAMVYLACIHMQIPIDMTTFTYCIFALGHILARQFPIVGFRPPVRLIDIIGRAADTRLHFYLHTFADQFDPYPPISADPWFFNVGSRRGDDISTIGARLVTGDRSSCRVKNSRIVSKGDWRNVDGFRLWMDSRDNGEC